MSKNNKQNKKVEKKVWFDDEMPSTSKGKVHYVADPDEDCKPSGSKAMRGEASSKDGAHGKIHPSSSHCNEAPKGPSQYRFGVLAKIVNHMKARYLSGKRNALSLSDILEETDQEDVAKSVKEWLAKEALVNNPKIEVDDSEMFCFKPPYKIKNGKGLIKLLKKFDEEGKGGILMDDVMESLRHCEKTLEKRASQITVVTRPNDGKKILFYKDPELDFKVDDNWKDLWHSISVGEFDDEQIKKYLEKQGHCPMQKQGFKKPISKCVLGSKRKRHQIFQDNSHLADILEMYEGDVPIPRED